MAQRFAGRVNAPDFPPDVDWLNTGRPLSLRDLHGKLVLLDFWTFCRINCLHILPQLRKLERKWSQELAVVGVHSPKFLSERETDAVRAAILRLNVGHPVLNDRDFRVWQAYAVRAWPTLMFVDPEGKVIGRHEGEFPLEPFDDLIAKMVEEFDAAGVLDRRPRGLEPERLAAPTPLRFPGKVLADAAGGPVFTRGTGGERHTLGDTAGRGEAGIGPGGPCLGGRSLGDAAFFQPQ